jgi:hypothetical protein
VDNGACEANSYILVPTATLEKVAVTYKEEDKQEEIAVPLDLSGKCGTGH